jgi:hypothetical protein
MPDGRGTERNEGKEKKSKAGRLEPRMQVGDGKERPQKYSSPRTFLKELVS